MGRGTIRSLGPFAQHDSMTRPRNDVEGSVSISLADLAKELSAVLDSPTAVGEVLVRGIAPITEAAEDQVTFLTDTKKVNRYRPSLESSQARAVIASVAAGPLPLPALRVTDVYLALRQALRLFHREPRPRAGIHPTAFVHEAADVHATASIGPMAVIEAGASIGAEVEIGAHGYVGPRAVIGMGSKLHPRVTILSECRVGADCVLHSGAVIGSDGFGFHSSAAGHAKIPQIGVVEVGDAVEIGANVTIDRATMGKTVIGSGTKIDNQVHIAHNSVIGRDCILVAQVGLSGSTILEDRVTLAGQVGTAGHVTVGHDTTVAARGVVTQDVPPKSLVSGFPLKPHAEEKRIMAALRRLPELIKTVRELKRLHGSTPQEE